MASPPLSPTVATPLAHRKRRHSVMSPTLETTQGNHAGLTTATPQTANGDTSLNCTNAKESCEIENNGHLLDDENDESLHEDILDSAELDPYKPCEFYLPDENSVLCR